MILLAQMFGSKIKSGRVNLMCRSLSVATSNSRWNKGLTIGVMIMSIELYSANLITSGKFDTCSLYRKINAFGVIFVHKYWTRIGRNKYCCERLFKYYSITYYSRRATHATILTHGCQTLALGAFAYSLPEPLELNFILRWFAVEHFSCIEDMFFR